MESIAFAVVVKGIGLVALLMLAAAYMTFMERVVMARMQLRLGPNRVGPFGLLQPIADGIKLLAKERFQPLGVDLFLYWLAPGISLFTAFFSFLLIPFGERVEWGGTLLSCVLRISTLGCFFFSPLPL